MSVPIILYTNRLASGTLTATDTETGYDVNNVIDWKTYTWHQFDAHGTKYYHLDAGSAVAADALGVAGHNFSTCSATVSVESSTDDASWTERLAGFTVTDNLAILKTFTTASARYWRIKIVTAAIAAKTAVVCLGPRLTFPSGVAPGSDIYNQGATVEMARSKTGHLLGTAIKYNPVTLSYRFMPSAADITWWTVTFKAFLDSHALGSPTTPVMKPFFYGHNLAAFATNVVFGKLPDGYRYRIPVSILTRTDGVQVDIEGIVL